MINYVDNLQETVKFFQSLLKKNGRLMMIVESGRQMLADLQTAQLL